jgi:hypothetical protein
MANLSRSTAGTRDDVSQALASVLAADVRLVWEAGLSIDRSDPYFFDHPLDHVPAMLLVETALTLVERAVGRGRPASRLRLEFQRFCEFEDAPRLRTWAAPNGPGCWCVEFVQGGATIGSGRIEHRARRGQPGRVEPQVAVAPVAPELVHRTRPENVLIGGFQRIGDDDYVAEMLSPPPGHYLRSRGDRVRSLGELIEGIRQFGTVLGHQARQAALDSPFIVQSVDISVDRPVARDERVVLRSGTLPRGSQRGSGAMTLSLHSSGTADAGSMIGRAGFTGHVVSPQAYERIRRMSQRAGR